MKELGGIWPERPSGCPAPVDLEAFAAGENSAPVQAHLETCEDCRAAVATLQGEREAFNRARPAELFLKQVQRRAEASPRQGWRLWLPAAAGLCAAAALVPLVFRAPEPEVRFKGIRMQVFAKRAGAASALPVANGAALRAGDSLRFSFSAPKPGYLAIFEKDARGEVTLFHPFGASGPAQVSPGAEPLLPGAVALDEAPCPCELVSVFSERPFELSAGALPGCEGCEVERLSYLKEAP